MLQYNSLPLLACEFKLQLSSSNVRRIKMSINAVKGNHVVA